MTPQKRYRKANREKERERLKRWLLTESGKQKKAAYWKSYYERLRSGGWKRADREANCIACGKRTKWRVERMVPAARGMIRRALPCCLCC